MGIDIARGKTAVNRFDRLAFRAGPLPLVYDTQERRYESNVLFMAYEAIVEAVSLRHSSSIG
jgi:hypothetical protein